MAARLKLGGGVLAVTDSFARLLGGLNCVVSPSLGCELRLQVTPPASVSETGEQRDRLREEAGKDRVAGEAFLDIGEVTRESGVTTLESGDVTRATGEVTLESGEVSRTPGDITLVREVLLLADTFPVAFGDPFVFVTDDLALAVSEDGVSFRIPVCTFVPGVSNFPPTDDNLELAR